MSTRRIRIHILFIGLLYGAESVAQNWQPISDEPFSGYKVVYTLRTDTAIEGLYVGGNFESIGNNSSLRSIALWKDGQWNALGNGLNSYMFSASLKDMAIYNGDLYVGGVLTDADGIACNGIARWDGSGWSGVGGGVTQDDGDAGIVWRLQVIGNELYACGGFVAAGGLTVNGLAKWNGTSWSDVHDFPFFDVEGDVVRDCIVYNNELYVVGDFDGGTTNGMLGIAKWNGSDWAGVGPVGTGYATRLIIYHEKLFVAGYFTAEMNPIFPGRHIASWDGSNWDDVGGGLGNPVGTVNDMMVHDDKLYAVGSFTSAGGDPAIGIATWDGHEWCDLGTVASNTLRAIEVFRDTVHIGAGPVTLNGSDLMSIARSGGGEYEENCGTLATIEEEQTDVNKLTIHPNPTTSTTTITWQGQTQTDYRLQLFDALGRRVAPPVSFPKNGEWEIDMRGLAPGIYFGQLVVGEERRSFKVVRE